MAHRRELDECDLTEGERTLIAGLGCGEVAVIGATRLGAQADEERQISAPFLRNTLTGGWKQLWAQCAKVLCEMGHEEEARKVLIEKEKRQRAAHWQRLRRDALFEVAYLARLRDGVLRWKVGYGYRPINAALWLAGFSGLIRRE